MASISTNYYNFSSGLFGNTSSTSSSSSSSILGDYASIKNGSYKKLLSAYYKKQNSESTQNTEGTTSASGKTELVSTKNAADELKTAVQKLTATGSKSLFEKVTKTVTDKTTGATSEVTDYDMDKIAGALKEFATAYNKTLDAAANTDTNSVLRKTTYMVSMTKANKNLLSKVGISIGADNKLTVDETKVANANMNDLKTLFQGSGSYADRVASKASDISNAATTALSANRIYGVNGKYSTFQVSGTLFDRYL